MSYDTIIIGAGLSGLGAGIRLAYFGKKVLIIEKHSLIGGLNSFYRRGGRTFDVGLHAVTNWSHDRASPLQRLLRQLRMRLEDFEPVEQKSSMISFNEASLTWSNDFSTAAEKGNFSLLESISRIFPDQIDGFKSLLSFINEFDALNLDNKPYSARKVVKEYISSELLIDMLFCPLCYYGSAVEDDMDLSQFVIMFRSVFLEGFWRPLGGIRPVLEMLKTKYLEAGGELLMSTAVTRIINDDNRATAVEIQPVRHPWDQPSEMGPPREIETRNIISSAGYIETMKLCGRAGRLVLEREKAAEGRLGYVESIFVLKNPPGELGYEHSIIFYNRPQNTSRFSYHRPEEAVELSSGVICVPGNFKKQPQSETSIAGEHILRVTNLANYEKWKKMNHEEYISAKKYWQNAQLEILRKQFSEISGHIVYTDMFTPVTIEKYTGHINGAIYGSPVKKRDGRTVLENLFIAGTDQGFLGITGSLLSGITIANRYCLS